MTPKVAKIPEPKQPATVHVALVGMTGVGKSTLVNVLQGKEIAEVNNNARPCTLQSIKYEVSEGKIKYCIWDTRGLNEALEVVQGTFPSRLLRSVAGWIKPDAEAELKKFLRGSNPKVDLVLLCVEMKKIRVSVHWKVYNKIFVDLCNRNVKVAVVITQMGESDFRGSQWKETCKVTAAKEVGTGFPDASLIEAVPVFEELGDPIVGECKSRVLGLISNACRIGKCLTA